MPAQYDQHTTGLALTLSALAYVDENRSVAPARMAADINAGLAASPYATWQVAWGPALNADRSNLMYVARDGASGALAVAIRGTDFLFWFDWIEDLANFALVPFSRFVCAAPADAHIAGGTALGLGTLLALTDNATTLQAFLASVPAATPVLVTGHSLGGCLASVLAPCIASWRGGSDGLSVYTFAAPSAGDAAFAAWYDALFTPAATPAASQAFRFYNTLDIVPNAWPSLAIIETYYQGFVACPDDLRRLIDFTAGVVADKNYRQVGDDAAGSAVPLAGHLIWPFDAARPAPQLDPVGDALFLWQGAQQHACATYQVLLGAPQVSALAGRLKQAVAGL